MLDLQKFIAEKVTGRSQSLLAADMAAHTDEIRRSIEGARVCVIGGAGSIGSRFIAELVRFQPASLVVIDIDENGLAELTRDLRSTPGITLPADYRTYAISFSDPLIESIFAESQGFDIVANFSAHKHVRSEKDRISVAALLQNNVLRAQGLMQLLSKYPPRRYFCVSTDKAANPVNIMGASKRLMEDLIMVYAPKFTVTTARFANVAFSHGSLPDGWLHRLQHRQPLAAPTDVKRYFVSPRESGQICLMACTLGHSGDIFFPRLQESEMKRFSDICMDLLHALGKEPVYFESEEDARRFAASMSDEENRYPVVFSRSDTTGEKPYEEFFTEDEKPDTTRFKELGVISRGGQTDNVKLYNCLEHLRSTLSKPDFTKEEIVAILTSYLGRFHHEELGRNLDQKM